MCVNQIRRVPGDSVGFFIYFSFFFSSRTRRKHTEYVKSDASTRIIIIITIATKINILDAFSAIPRGETVARARLTLVCRSRVTSASRLRAYGLARQFCLPPSRQFSSPFFSFARSVDATAAVVMPSFLVAAFLCVVASLPATMNLPLVDPGKPNDSIIINNNNSCLKK